MITMNFIEQLKARAKETGNIVCMGIDPVLERIPIEGGTVETKLTQFYLEILEAVVSGGTSPALVKPNYAFFAQYGFEGLRALKKIIESYQGRGIPVLLDAKRGDIGKTSIAYAREVFEFWQADAVTIHPYLGSDSVSAFLEWCRKGKGVYVLVRTSNKGAVDIQDLDVNGSPVYMKVAQKLLDWHTSGLGAVVGATYPKELEELSRSFVESGKEVPMLIPGVGAQGGGAQDVVKALKSSGNELALHRINSSSGINYAYERFETDDYAGAAVRAIQELNRELQVLGIL